MWPFPMRLWSPTWPLISWPTAVSGWRQSAWAATAQWGSRLGGSAQPFAACSCRHGLVGSIVVCYTFLNFLYTHAHKYMYIYTYLHETETETKWYIETRTKMNWTSYILCSPGRAMLRAVRTRGYFTSPWIIYYPTNRARPKSLC